MNRNLIYCFLVLFTVTSFISCSKEYSLETGLSTKARGSLHDDAGDCFTSSVKGNYFTGVPVSNSSYIELQVNVTTPGSYKIASDTVNGFSFENSGVFSATGLQTIRLQAAGVPTQVQVSNFFISFDSTICLFSVNVQDSTGGTGGVNYSDTAWSFTEGSKKFNGYIDTAFTFDTVFTGIPVRIMQIQGSTAYSGDSLFLVSVVFPLGSVTPGIYSTTTTASFRYLASYNINDTIYSANPLTPTVNTIVNISSYNATTRIVVGTLSGTAKNRANGNVNITVGKFEAKLN